MQEATEWKRSHSLHAIGYFNISSISEWTVLIEIATCNFDLILNLDKMNLNIVRVTN